MTTALEQDGQLDTVSDGGAELYGNSLGIGEISRPWTKGDGARTSRERENKKTSALCSRKNTCGVNQVTAEEDAQGIRQSLRDCPGKVPGCSRLTLVKPRRVAGLSCMSVQFAA
ncbi:hypothetical protein [Mesorhizobium sp. BR1-1-6]|uniref:hypothetical protein n=1 Tax=Mesorhizobium sp. BR1-1-6 TaxID=2876648 RepID=UPI00398D292C